MVIKKRKLRIIIDFWIDSSIFILWNKTYRIRTNQKI